MSGIFKPIAPKFLDVKNSLVSGLVFAAELFEGNGSAALDLANNVSGVFTNAPVWGTRSPYGKVITFANNTNIVLYTSIGAQNSLAQASCEALVFPTVADTADKRYFHKGPDSKYFAMAYTNASGLFEFSSTWGSVEGDWDTPASFPANVAYHVVTTYDYGNVNNTPHIYVNAVDQSLSMISTPSGSAPVDSTDMGVGNRPVTKTKGFVGDVFYVRYWNRILSQAEVTALYQNPWRIYLPVQTQNHMSANGGNGMSFGERIR